MAVFEFTGMEGFRERKIVLYILVRELNEGGVGVM